MSQRRTKAASKNKIIAYSAAILVHGLIIAIMVFNVTKKTTVIDAHDAETIDVVKATTIDESQIKQQQDKIKQKDKEKKRQQENEKKRLAELKKQAELEQQRINDLQNQQQEELAKTEELEKQRKTIALKKEKERKQAIEDEKKRLEEKEKRLAEKKREEEKRIKKQKAADEIKRLEAIAKKEKERKDKERQEQERAAQKQFADQLKIEEGRQRTATLVSRHGAMVISAINGKRTIAPDFDPWLVAKLNIKLSSLGDVESVSVVKSSGNTRYDSDAEKAVLNASPLPIPSLQDDEAANETFRDITLNIKMPDA